MNSYKVLNKQAFSLDNYSLVPIRMEDRYDIMNWRNEQIDLLRQKNPLTKENQDTYFDNVISELFDQDYPDQILFSFLKDNILIGYGGFVHIDWKNRNAEISFLLEPSLNNNIPVYSENFDVFLALMEEIAFLLEFHKIYTYGYDLLSFRFEPLVKRQYILEVILKDHVVIRENLYDVKIYSKFIVA